MLTAIKLNPSKRRRKSWNNGEVRGDIGDEHGNRNVGPAKNSALGSRYEAGTYPEKKSAHLGQQSEGDHQNYAERCAELGPKREGPKHGGHHSEGARSSGWQANNWAGQISLTLAAMAVKPCADFAVRHCSDAPPTFAYAVRT
ncbi:MAG: hypothetical protein ACKVJN_18200 [Woeseiales bacterium]|jgi:hypothetical protein